MSEWVAPLSAALGGGVGLGAILTAIITARNSSFNQLKEVITTLQAERAHDQEKHQRDRLEDRELQADLRAKHEALDGKVNSLQSMIGLYRDWSDTLLAWGRAGGPPPEPVKPSGLSTFIP